LTSANPGFWYSSLKGGYCGNSSSMGIDAHVGAGAGAATDACTWQVTKVVKVVSRACHAKVFGDLVQASAPPACLDGCGSQKTNTSSPCWVNCFYLAVSSRMCERGCFGNFFFRNDCEALAHSILTL
jgi:hypothetical protein